MIFSYFKKYRKKKINIDNLKKILIIASNESTNRFELWQNILNKLENSVFCEVGVWKGDFAKHILDNVQDIKSYIFIDPWKNLPNWNKPANVSDEAFNIIRKEAFSKNKNYLKLIKEYRMTTKEAVKQIDKNSIDFAYIDGDHTLRGITIDLTQILTLVRFNGLIGGDDLAKNIWQHPDNFDPTLIFPFVVHFAEANNLVLFTLPFEQFLIVKTDYFQYFDLENYSSLSNHEIYSKPKK